MTLEVLRISSRVEILNLAGRHGTHNVRVFGSVARGDCSASSDVDLLVDLEPERTLMDLGGLLILQTAVEKELVKKRDTKR